MSEDKNDQKEKDRDQLLKQILRVFGRRQETGEPPLESLPPSRRLVPNAPLSEPEVDAIIWADLWFYGIKEAPPDDPVYQQGWTISFLPRSMQKSWPSLQESQPGTEPGDERTGTAS